MRSPSSSSACSNKVRFSKLRAGASPPSRYTAATTASKASASSVGFSRPPVFSPRRRVPHVRAALRELPFRPLRKVGKQVLAGKQLEHRVAQKFEPLVVFHGRRFRRVLARRRAQFRYRGTMRERPLQQQGTPKRVSQPLLQSCFVVGALPHHPQLRRGRAYFGALNSVAPSFFASSAPFLQVLAMPPGNVAHLLKAATASSKCEAFSFASPSK